MINGILQARILGVEWGGMLAFPFSRVSSQPRNRTQVSRIADRFFNSRATSKAKNGLTYVQLEADREIKAKTKHLIFDCTILIKC